MKLYSLTSLKTVLPAFCAFLIFAGPAQAKKLIDKSVMNVNDDIILESDIDKFQQKIKSKSFQEFFGGIDEKTAKDRNAVLALLVEEKIINQQVKKLDLGASDQEIDGQIRVILKRNNITQQQLNERLKMLGTGLAEYRDGIKRQIERRNLVEREIKPTLEVSDEQLRHFYQRNAKAEDSQVQYNIAHILIEDKPKGGISAEDRAKKIWKELSENPKNFETFVKDYSDDNTNSAAGGALGYFSAGSLNKEFREVVPKTPVGEITAPIKTSAGYHIVKVLGTQKGDFNSLPKERKDALRNQLISEELEKRMGMWLERKKSEAYIRKSGSGYANQ
jgi:parvulin-like peptidyl-prolyl isomerase